MDDFNKLINKLPLVIDGEWIKKNSNYESKKGFRVSGLVNIKFL